MDEVKIRSQQTVTIDGKAADKFELEIKASHPSAARGKARLFIRRNSLITPAIPQVSKARKIPREEMGWKRRITERELRDTYLVDGIIWR